MNYPDLPKRKCFSEDGESCYTEDDLYSFADATVALRTPTAERESSVPEVTASIVAGALFDFMGGLTSGETRYQFSAYHEAGPAVEALKAFMKLRNIECDPNVTGWRAALAASPSIQEAEKKTSGLLNSESSSRCASKGEADARDAARYRYLRDVLSIEDVSEAAFHMGSGTPDEAQSARCDEIVDQLRKEQSK